jgi:YVTN family beta-propeller protein
MGNGLGMNTQFDTTVFPVVTVIDLETGSHKKTENISLADVDQPVGLPWDTALAIDDRELWVVNAGSNNISVIDISNPNLPARVANIEVSHNPRGIVFSPEGNTAFVHNTLAGTVSVIDTQTYSLIDEIASTSIPLPPLLLEGKRLFHSSARPELAQASWISCNTCHVEGEQDGRTWFVQFLGEVPPGEQPVIKRNTTSLLGMLETYPLRWSGEWDESADSEFSIRFEQFGTGLIAGEMHDTLGIPNQGRSAELDALAAFIDSLPVPEREINLTPAELRGKEIFESLESGCLECHPPPLFTDLASHDVGTGDKPGEWFGAEFDTPTLRYLFDSAPYLHDGISPDLLHLLTDANPADQHGVTSHLNDQELEDLIAYLMVLPHN